MATMRLQNYDFNDWRLIIDSSKRCLKFVLSTINSLGNR